MCMETVLKDVNRGTVGLIAKKVNPYFQRCYQCDTFYKVYTLTSIHNKCNLTFCSFLIKEL